MAQATGCLGSQEQEEFLTLGRVVGKLLDFINHIGIEALLSFGHPVKQTDGMPPRSRLCHNWIMGKNISVPSFRRKRLCHNLYFMKLSLFRHSGPDPESSFLSKTYFSWIPDRVRNDDKEY